MTGTLRQARYANRFGGLVWRQEIFVWRFALHGNARHAYTEAYGHDNGASQSAHRLLEEPHIARRLERLIRHHQQGNIDLNAGPWEYWGLTEPPNLNLTIPARRKTGGDTVGYHVLNRLTGGLGVYRKEE